MMSAGDTHPEPGETKRSTVLLTLRLLTHLNEYLHFLDFHLPFPQLFLPGTLAVFVGVSGRSALVPLSTLTASSCKHTTSVIQYSFLEFFHETSHFLDRRARFWSSLLPC